MNWIDITSQKVWIFCVVFLIFSSTGRSRVLPGNGAPGEVCEIENGVMGNCETAAACSADGGLISRNGTTRTCSKSGEEDYYCCRKPYQVAYTLCESWKSYWRGNDNKCIHSKPMIVGGEEAEVGQFPEIAILGIERSARRVSWQCGGTLISPHFVLTAAHCVLDFVQYVVRFGEHNLFENEVGNISRVIGPVPLGLFGERDLQLENRNTVPVEQYELVDDVIIHPGYDRRYHDIALLKLKRPVVVTKRTLPACLPTDSENDYADEKLTVAGWGRILYDDYQLSPSLQKVAIPVIGKSRCEEDLNKMNPFLIPKGITEELICAGEPGKDSCKGDSGGPLLFQARDSATSIPCEHTIVGIVSFGNGCGRFGIYIKVSSYVDWITGYIAPAVIPVQRTPALSGLSADRATILFPN